VHSDSISHIYAYVTIIHAAACAVINSLAETNFYRQNLLAFIIMTEILEMRPLKARLYGAYTSLKEQYID